MIDTDKVVVSICCLAYNHEKYIKDALEGFISQKTSFKFEVLIHDDASTDQTAKIIADFALEYPDIIKPIYQTINQWSLGVRPTFQYNFPRAKGEYIALCEGDDYWTDSYKLQKQVDALRAHVDCDLCFHSTLRLDDKTKKTTIDANHFSTSRVVEVEKVILGDGHYCPTASILFRKELFPEVPPIFFTAPVGDYFLQVLGALRGGAVYLNECMSVYRINTGIAWRDSVSQVEKKEAYLSRFNKSIDDFDIYLEGRYHQQFQQLKANSNSYIALLYLRNRQFDRFQYNINLSVETYPKGALFTRILYRFKNFPQLLYLIISLKNKVLR